MKIIKRNGSEVTFDVDKIENAIAKANAEVNGEERLTNREIRFAALNVTDECMEAGHTVTVEEVQDLVEDQLMALDHFEVARKYIIYRYVQNQRRQKNTTDDKILSLIECNNEEVKQENSNKNPTVVSVQRDYMAGEVSKDLVQRELLPEDIVQAHNEGLIHFHDSDYFAQHMHNCDLINLDDMLQNGTVISGTLIERPHSFSTACNIATQIIAQVASCQYGGQSISLAHLAPFVDVSRRKIRKAVMDEMNSVGVELSAEQLSDMVEKRLHDEVSRGVQTIQYQVVTLMTTNGQAPFITVFMYLNEAKSEQEKKDLALIIEEMLRQRYQGVILRLRQGVAFRVDKLQATAVIEVADLQFVVAGDQLRVTCAQLLPAAVRQRLIGQRHAALRARAVGHFHPHFLEGARQTLPHQVKRRANYEHRQAGIVGGALHVEGGPRAALGGVLGAGGIHVKAFRNDVQHSGAVALQRCRIGNRFTRLLQIHQLNDHRLLITLRFDGDLITTAILLIFIKTVPLNPVGVQRLARIIALGDNVVLRLKNTGDLCPQRTAAAVLDHQRRGIAVKLGPRTAHQRQRLHRRGR